MLCLQLARSYAASNFPAAAPVDDAQWTMCRELMAACILAAAKLPPAITTQASFIPLAAAKIGTSAMGSLRACEDEADQMVNATTYRALASTRYGRWWTPHTLARDAAQLYLFARCHELQIATEAPLETVLNAGVFARPAFQDAARLAVATSGGHVFSLHAAARNGGGVPPLSVDIQLPPQLRFHTVFVCPVVRHECNPATNPPMLLPCGHVISHEALTRMLHSRTRAKCPTCPAVFMSDDALSLSFGLVGGGRMCVHVVLRECTKSETLIHMQGACPQRHHKCAHARACACTSKPATHTRQTAGCHYVVRCTSGLKTLNPSAAVLIMTPGSWRWKCTSFTSS
ncbi:hypothetical protein EON66_04655 [archaeon]|nr:MAG: hypothetical protein EON66_04655 [archaeon]